MLTHPTHWGAEVFVSFKRVVDFEITSINNKHSKVSHTEERASMQLHIIYV